MGWIYIGMYGAFLSPTAENYVGIASRVLNALQSTLVINVRTQRGNRPARKQS